jgi:hypothetical protein
MFSLTATIALHLAVHCNVLGFHALEHRQRSPLPSASRYIERETNMANGPLVTTELVELSPEISWTAVIAGALVATATIFFLLALGSGVGLSLTSVWHADQDTAQHS